MSTTTTKTVSLTEWCIQHDVDVPPVRLASGHDMPIAEWTREPVYVTDEPIYTNRHGEPDGVAIYGVYSPDGNQEKAILVDTSDETVIYGDVQDYGVALDGDWTTGMAYYASTTEEMEAIKAFVPTP